MKTGFKHTILVRLAVALLTLAAPAVLSGCGDNATEEYNKQLKAHEDEYKVIDDGLIQDYLKRKNITEGPGVGQYERVNTEGAQGLYLVRLSDGPSAGKKIVAGNQVEVKYVGRFLRATNETNVFDNSTDKRIPCGCYTVTVGANSVIPGWEKALLEMKQGDRKLLLVPSYLGYGPNGRTDSNGQVVIPGDEPLLFDMEVLTVR